MSLMRRAGREGRLFQRLHHVSYPPNEHLLGRELIPILVDWHSCRWPHGVYFSLKVHESFLGEVNVSTALESQGRRLVCLAFQVTLTALECNTDSTSTIGCESSMAVWRRRTYPCERPYRNIDLGGVSSNSLNVGTCPRTQGERIRPEQDGELNITQTRA